MWHLPGAPQYIMAWCPCGSEVEELEASRQGLALSMHFPLKRIRFVAPAEEPELYADVFDYMSGRIHEQGADIVVLDEASAFCLIAGTTTLGDDRVVDGRMRLFELLSG